MDWKKFTSREGQETFELPQTLNQTGLDHCIEALNKTLTNIIHDLCPMTTPKQVSSLSCAWHTPELKALRRKVSRLFAHYKTLKTTPTLK